MSAAAGAATSSASGGLLPAGKHDLRLLLPAVVSWLGAIAVLTAGAVVAGLVTAGLGLAAIPVGRRWPDLRPLLGVCAVALLAMLVSVGTRQHAAESNPLRAAEGHPQVSLTVTGDPHPMRSRPGYGSTPSGPPGMVITGTLHHARIGGSDLALGGRVVLLTPLRGWKTVLPGQRVRASGTVLPPRGGDLTAAVLAVDAPPQLLGEPPWWQEAAGVLRGGLREAAEPMGPQRGGLLPALVDGDTSGLPEQVRQDFRTTGLTHLNAVSGSNLAILVGAVLLLGRAVRAGPRSIGVLALMVVLGFVVLARPQPSVLRAAVMGALALLAMIAGRPRAVLPALALSVLALLHYDPALATAPGFALSVLATGGLVVLAPGWARRMHSWGLPLGVAEAVAVATAAHVVTAPVVAGISGRVSLIGIAANLLAGPVVPPLTVLGVLAAALAPISTQAAQLLLWPARPLLSWLLTVASTGAAVPGASLPWPGGVWGAAGLVLALLAVVLALRRRMLRTLIVGAVLGLVAVLLPLRLMPPGWPPPDWAMVACDVGQGDGLVLATGRPGAAVVVDTGPRPRAMRRCLDRLGVQTVPLVVITHLHADHYGGLAGVLRGRTVGAIAMSPARVPRWALAKVRQQAAGGRAEVPLVTIEDGMEMRWPRLGLRVLGPGPLSPAMRGRTRASSEHQVTEHQSSEHEFSGEQLNDGSVVLEARWPGGTALLSGDIEESGQRSLLRRHLRLRADVLKVPHHGSKDGSGRFFRAVAPQLSVISVGADNDYGHPSPTALRRLRALGSRIARTDRAGDVAVTAGQPMQLVRGGDLSRRRAPR